MLAEPNVAPPCQYGCQLFFALLERLRSEVAPVQVEKVENVIGESPGAGFLKLLQQLKARLPFVIQGDDLPIQHHIVVEFSERLHDRRELDFERLQITRIQLYLAA